MTARHAGTVPAPRRRRNPALVIRLTPGELGIIEHRARLAGLSRSEYVRRALKLRSRAT